MRLATLSDEAFVRNLRNDPVARRWSGTKTAISPDAHHAWYCQALRRDDLYVDDIGTVRIAKSGEVSIVVAPGYRGQGRSRALLVAGLAAAPRRRYTATIHRRNVASLVLFLKVGFTPMRMDGNFLVLEKRP